MRDEIKSELVITDFDGSVEELTASIGLKPTKVITKGDVKRSDPTGKRPPIVYEKNVWVMLFNTTTSASVFEHLDAALIALRPYADVISSISKKYTIELSLYGFAHDATRQAFNLTPEQLNGLANLNVSLDVDVYPTAD